MLNRLWKFFTSLRLTVVLLLTLAATSIIGTLIPQNESPTAYFQEYGELLFRLFSLLGIFDMYHSWWFQALLILLTANIVVCSINRLSATKNIIFVKNPAFDISRFRRLKHKEEFEIERSSEQLKKRYLPFFERSFSHSRIEKTQTGYCIFAEKGRWTRLGVYLVHSSIILLLIGGLIGSIFGFDGFVNIPEGEAVGSIRLRNGDKIFPLGFEVRCEDFKVSFYDSGAPKEYRSSLTILEQGNPVLHKDIIVNDPLRYKGINMFQSSYGRLAPNEVTLSFTSKATGNVYRQAVRIGQAVEIPEDKGTFVLKEFIDSAQYKGHDIGEAYIGTLTPKDGAAGQVVLPLRFPSFDKMRNGHVVIALTDQKQRFYTGLQVTKDPGVGLVYTGFIVLILGCYITFFLSHQQVCVEVVEKADKSRVVVCGTANRNKMGMQKKVKVIAEKLAKMELHIKGPGIETIKHRAEGAGHRV